MSRGVASVLAGLAAGTLVGTVVCAQAPVDAALRAVFVRPPVVQSSSAPAVLELGRQLFFDPSVSGNGTLSCAGCHKPELAWQDGRPRAIGEDGSVGARRTPSLIDAGHNETFFWDGRAHSLEEQVLRPIQAPNEMNRTLDSLVETLRASGDYSRRFAIAFPEARSKITPDTIADALAAFVRTIESGETPFDRWARGDDAAIDDQAKRGFALFNGKANCAVCHTGWRFSDEAFHDIGLPLGAGPVDKGRGPIIGVARADHAFRTPPLRNVASRQPYMHDGSVKTLRAAIDHYADGIVKRETLSDDLKPITLSTAEREELEAFLETLTPDRDVVATPVVIAASAVIPSVAKAIVSQKDKNFSMTRVRLASQGKLTILNEDTTTHNIQVYDPRLTFNSGAQEPGQSVELGFPSAGMFTVFCGIHPKMKLRVEAE